MQKDDPLDKLVVLLFLPIELARGKSFEIRLLGFCLYPIWAIVVGLPVMLIFGLPGIFWEIGKDIWEDMKRGS